MQLKKIIYSLLLVSFAATMEAQDIHYTMFDMAPLHLNPALSGGFEGTARIGGIYREQWRSAFKQNRYVTYDVNIDAPILNGFQKGDWVGIGVRLLKDDAGFFNLQSSGFFGSIAYHKALDKKGKNILTLGVQGGQTRRSLNTGNLGGDQIYFGDESVLTGGAGVGQSQDFNTLDNTFANGGGGQGRFGLAVGLKLKAEMNKQNWVEVGFAGSHLLKEANSLLMPTVTTRNATDDQRIGRRFNLHGTWHSTLNNKKWSLHPSVYVSTIGNLSEAAVQTWAGYLFNKDKDVNLRFGLGHRLGRDMQLLLGYKQKDLLVGVSYDVNVSPWNVATNYRGGWELAANYIIKIYKNPTVPPVILCPQL